MRAKAIVFIIITINLCISLSMRADDMGGEKRLGEVWYDDSIYLHDKLTESNITKDGKNTGLYVVISYYEKKYYIWLLKEYYESNKTIIQDIKIIDNSGNVIVNIGSCIYKNEFNDNIVVAYNDSKVRQVNSDEWINEFIVAYMPNIETGKLEEIDMAGLACQHQLFDNID